MQFGTQNVIWGLKNGGGGGKGEARPPGSTTGLGQMYLRDMLD